MPIHKSAGIPEPKGSQFFIMYGRDIYVLKYGTTKWGWKFERGVMQKLFNSKDDAVFYAVQMAKRYESDVYVEDVTGGFKKLKQ
jgi:hypothetical protein